MFDSPAGIDRVRGTCALVTIGCLRLMCRAGSCLTGCDHKIAILHLEGIVFTEIADDGPGLEPYLVATTGAGLLVTIAGYPFSLGLAVIDC